VPVSIDYSEFSTSVALVFLAADLGLGSEATRSGMDGTAFATGGAVAVSY
jgi:hypothetical protein